MQVGRLRCTSERSGEMSLHSIYRDVTKEVNLVDRFLVSHIASDDPTIDAAGQQLLQAGGKRIRPAFVLLASKFGQANRDELVRVAASLELIHMASLVHDDVIDDAELRRGKPTVMQHFDEEVALYSGNYLFGEAVKLIGEVGKPELVQVMVHAMREICEGEIEQIYDQYDWEQSIKRYIKRIERKTAILIEASCHLGAIVANCSPADTKALRQFGRDIGLAFQIADDLLDFTAKRTELGKPVAEDLRHGHKTLPVFYAAENPSFFQELQKIQSMPTHQEVAPVLELLHQTDALERTQRTVDLYIQRAIHRLDHLPKSSAKRSLEEVARYVGKRKG